MVSSNVQVNKELTPVKESTYYTKQPIHLQIGEIADARGNEKPKVIVQKRDGFGDSMAGVIADRPITEIIHQYLKQGFTQLGYNTKPGASDYILLGDLNKIQYNYNNTDRTIKPVFWLDIELKLLSSKTNRIIWQKQMRVYGKIPGVDFRKPIYLGEAFNNMVIDLVRQLQQSKSLYGAMH